MARIKYKQIVQNENSPKYILEGIGIQKNHTILYKEKEMLIKIFFKEKEVFLLKKENEKEISLHFKKGKRQEGILKIEGLKMIIEVDTKELIQKKGFLKILYETKSKETKIDKVKFEFYYEVI